MLDEDRAAAQRTVVRRRGEGGAHRGKPADTRPGGIAAREAALRQERAGRRVRGLLLGERQLDHPILLRAHRRDRVLGVARRPAFRERQAGQGRTFA